MNAKPATAAALLALRASSARLSNKAMRRIAGTEVVHWLIRRYLASPRLRPIIVATSDSPEDDPIARAVRSYQPPVHLHRSPLSAQGDVVGLLDGALRAHAPSASFVFRAMGDCPLMETSLVEERLDVLAYSGADLAWPGQPDDPWPVYGARESPWSRHAWDLTVQRSTGEEREHPGLYIYRHLRLFRVELLPPVRVEYYRPYRLELDEPDDLRMFRRLYKALNANPDDQPMLLDAVRLLDARPEIAAINADVPTRTLTDPDWRRRGAPFRCPNCGATALRTVTISDGSLVTVCPRCGRERRFTPNPPKRRRRR